MDLVSNAMHFAIDAFYGTCRKGDGKPAILHAVEAASIAASLTDEKETIAAAVLHDVIEDAEISADTIKAEFGERVACLVCNETEDKRSDIPPRQSWKTRKQEAINDLKICDDLQVKIIMLGDKLSNMRSFYNLKTRYGTKMWDSFNQNDPELHHWYYRTIADNMQELTDTLAWKEYDALICAVFDENKKSEESK